MASDTTRTPTIQVRALSGRTLVIHPATGAATTPPAIKPASDQSRSRRPAVSQCPESRAARKAAAVAAATNTSAVLVVPMALRGSAPAPSSELVTTGPQPPPPVASKKPPTRPSGKGDLQLNTLGRVCRQAR